MATYWMVAGFVVVTLTLSALIVSFVVPHWLGLSRPEDGFADSRMGLWGSCGKNLGDECTWIYEEEFHWNKLPDWFKACQGLFTLGLLSVMTAFFLSCIHMCCRFCRYICLTNVILAILVTSFLLVTIAVAVFGGNADRTPGVSVEWGYWCGWLGACLNLLAVFIYLFLSCCKAKPSSYY